MNPLYQLLNQANTLVVNRLLAHALGTNEAIIYACLISKYYYYADRNMLNDGWFYSTAPDLQESSKLSEKQQKRAVENLVKAGLLTINIISARYSDSKWVKCRIKCNTWVKNVAIKSAKSE